VFSVHQTDIIYYGAHLQNYLENEFSYYFRGAIEALSDRHWPACKWRNLHLRISDSPIRAEGDFEVTCPSVRRSRQRRDVKTH